MACGTNEALLRLLAEQAVHQLIKDGEIQAALHDCSGAPLVANTRLPTCDTMTDHDTRIVAVSVDEEDNLAIVTVDRATPDAAPEVLRTKLSVNRVLKNVRVQRVDCGAGYELVLTEQEQEWRVPLPKPRQYHGTLQLTLATFGNCNSVSRVVYGYHPDDIRDPAASVALRDCDGDAIGWLYPDGTHAGTIPIHANDEAETLIGYAMPTPTAEVWD